MRASTGQTFASLLALALASTGCSVEVSSPPPDDDGFVKVPVPTPSCAKTNATTDSVFTRTSGPDVARFRFVAATSEVVVASTGTSLHRSLDQGATWSLVDAAPLRGASLQALVTHGDDIFVSMSSNEGPGLFRSTDGGQTWKVAATEACATPSYLTSDGKNLFAQQFGQTFQWDAVAETWLPLPVADNFFDVIESDGTYIYGNSIYAPGVYRLELGVADAVWTPVVDLPEWGYSAFAFDGQRGFAANDSQIFQTLDGGATWKQVSTNASVQDMLVADGKIFASTYEGLRVSADGGATWTQIGDQLFSTPFGLASSGGHLFAASDALRRTTPDKTGTLSWELLHPIGDAVYALHATKNAVLSMSDGHLLRSLDHGQTWAEVRIDGELAGLSNVVVRPGVGDAPDEVFALRYVQNQGTIVVVSRDDGATFAPAGSITGSDEYTFVSFLAVTDDGLVAGLNEGAGSGCADVQDITTTLYRSADGVSWAPAMNHFPVTFTDCYGEDWTPGFNGFSAVGDALFAHGYWKGTYRSVDQGQSWQPLATTADLGAVRSIVGDATAIVGIADKGGIARSSDAGVSWVASGLEGLAVSSLVKAGDVLYATVASSDPNVSGVYTSTDLGATWARVDAVFDARVQSVVVQGGQLFAGTLDESVWTAPLSCAP